MHVNQHTFFWQMSVVQGNLIDFLFRLHWDRTRKRKWDTNKRELIGFWNFELILRINCALFPYTTRFHQKKNIFTEMQAVQDYSKIAIHSGLCTGFLFCFFFFAITKATKTVIKRNNLDFEMIPKFSMCFFLEWRNSFLKAHDNSLWRNRLSWNASKHWPLHPWSGVKHLSCGKRNETQGIVNSSTLYNSYRMPGRMKTTWREQVEQQRQCVGDI